MDTKELFESEEKDFDKELNKMTKKEMRGALCYAWGYISTWKKLQEEQC